MDMPNTNPQTTTLEALEEKFTLLGEKSAVNYSCYFGATNTNYTQFAQLDKHRVCGVKLFMGSSTGNMLVDRMASLRNIFGGTDLLIAAHCEDQGIIKENTDKYKKEYGDDVPLALHPLLRSEEACYRSSELAVQLARETPIYSLRKKIIRHWVPASNATLPSRLHKTGKPCKRLSTAA